MADKVRVWEQTMTMPTYTPPAPDRNPMFLEKRVNQGTSGRVYPWPFTDGLSSTSEDQDYQAVYLENEYLQLILLPQFGGRIHQALDKTNGYHFIYRQHVVKPALIGLFGAWMSGGIEFNWPQHHRPSTYMPSTHTIEHGEDGSVTVWMSENDPLQRMKGMVGVCMYPDKALFELKVQLYNRTPEVQTFLWWINIGVHVHDKYQTVFPPDVTSVTDHSKRSMSNFPVAKGTYYGIDYSNEGKGTDFSWFDAIPVPTSYFVWDTGVDYFGGYDHKADAGIIHVANRFIAPGKKMFTWGAGEFAKGWESNLTDNDGPYIELMAGAYTDNQPDFSWLQPYETKTFSQYLYPVQKIGPAKFANQRAAVNINIGDGKITYGVAVTEAIPGSRILLNFRSDVLADVKADLAPDAPYLGTAMMPKDEQVTDLLLRVLDAQGNEVIRYVPQVIEPLEVLPEALRPPDPPETFETIEELYLTGLHLEQYRHPIIEPEPYWEAALVKDPTDVRCNNAMGLVYLRRGQFDKALGHFQAAIDKLTRRNPNPRDGEVFFNKGMALKYKGDLDGAYAAFYKAIWSYAWQAAGYLALAEIDCIRSDFHTALSHINKSLITNTMNMKARNLKASILRKLGKYDEAGVLCAETAGLDPLDMVSRFEAALRSAAQGQDDLSDKQFEAFVTKIRTVDPLSDIQAMLDMVFDYANAGMWHEAYTMLSLVSQDGVRTSPTVKYVMGYCMHKLGADDKAAIYFSAGSEAPVDFCFPVRLEEMLILEYIQSLRPEDGRVAYHLGNLYYDKKRYTEAIACWEAAVQAEPEFSIPQRNLGIAYYNVQHDAEKAIKAYEKAFAANPDDGRVLSELDQLRQRMGVDAETRLRALEARLDLVQVRDDLSVILASLYNHTHQPQKALDYVMSRRFHPWEGGTGSVSQQYVTALVKLGRNALDSGNATGALKYFLQAQDTYPVNLGERKHLLWPDAEVNYYTGLAYQALGNEAASKASFEKVLAAKDGVSESVYYKALAQKALGEAQAAKEILEQMLEKAKAQLEAQAQRGFATSIPEFVFAEGDAESRRKLHLIYMTGLAYLGLGQDPQASDSFHKVLALNPNHFGALEHLRELGA